METVEIVIKIPQEILNTIWAYVQSEIHNKNIISDTAYKAIANGTVLPKGHGELIDKKQLFNMPLGGEYTLKDATKYGNLCAEQQHFSYSTLMMYELADIIEDAPTVIEANKEEKA